MILESHPVLLPRIIELCLSKCYFLWNEKIYLLENSAPIGLALMVVIAEAFLQYHEKNAIDTALRMNPPVAPKSFLRYVDDSHARFKDMQQAEKFQQILNEQSQQIKYTIEIEDSSKSLQFLDLDVKNNNGQYEMKVYRKAAITNVQVKPNSGHDPKVLKSIFTGFLHRAYSVCHEKYRQDEINFLIDNFVENGYNKGELIKIETDYRKKREETTDHQPKEEEPNKIVKLPWIPGISPKLRKSFRKAGYKAVFKSTSNLKTILTSKNKSSLPSNSHPGVYKISCKCGKKYVGETKLKISSRAEQHKMDIFNKKWTTSGITQHAEICKEGYDWENVYTLKIEDNRFDRKMRESLEIQLQETSPHNEQGLNLDDSQ